MGLVRRDTGVQAVYGPKADVLKSDILDVLESNAPIPASTIDQAKELKSTETVDHTVNASLETPIQSVATGEVMAITEVDDQVFSQKMMGDGFAVVPSEDEVVSPINGTVQSVFPTKHAIGLLTDSGHDVLVHMGIDTVELQGSAFDVFIEEGQTVKAGDALATMNRAAVKEAGKATDILVVFTNLTEDQAFDLTETGESTASTVIGKIKG